MESDRKIKVTAVLATVLFALTLGVLGFVVRIDKNNRALLRNAKLKNESLLSEKLDLQRQIAGFKNDLKGLLGRNTELDEYLEQARRSISEKEHTIRRLLKENASMAVLRKENETIQVMRNHLLERISQLSHSNEALNVELERFKKQNSELLDQLTAANIHALEHGSVGNFRIDPKKKQANKLTIKASRTNSVVVSFDVPKGSSDDVSYSTYRMVLQKLEGSDVDGSQQAFRVHEDKNLTASTGNEIAKVADRVSISFVPKEKLQEGIYSITIFEGNEQMGAAQVRLIK